MSIRQFKLSSGPKQVDPMFWRVRGILSLGGPLVIPLLEWEDSALFQLKRTGKSLRILD